MSGTAANPHLQTATQTWGASLNDARLVVLAVHGRGQTPEYIHTITDRLGLGDLAVVAPTADGESWYPNPFMQPLESNQPRLGQALEAVDEAIAGLVRAGIPFDRIVLLGFSQGACLLSHYALTHPRRYGALVLFTGGYIGPADTDPGFAGDFAGMPTVLRSASGDSWVPPERVVETAAELRRLGAEVDAAIEEGSEHVVTDESIAVARNLLAAQR